MFTEHTVPASDTRLEAVYTHFQRNLEDIVGLLQRKGAHVLLSPVPVNLRDSAPFASLHGADLSDDEMAQWDETANRATAGFDEQAWETAISEFEAAVTIDPDHADTRFRLAAAYENTGDFQEASEHYEKARDLDGLRFRADSRINAVVRNVASEYAGSRLTFVDSESAFDQASQPRRPGWNLFLEHVHFDFPGNYLLAREFTHSILDQLGIDEYAPLSEDAVAS